jgi:hypothetical protein
MQYEMEESHGTERLLFLSETCFKKEITLSDSNIKDLKKLLDKER